MDEILTYVYSDPRSADRAVKRLCKRGLLVPSYGWFIPSVEKVQKTLGEVLDVRAV